MMIFTYDAGAPQARANPTWSSYFFDFPHQRLHTTAVHNPGGTSNHSGSLTYTAVLSSTTTFNFHIGRGQSGNYAGPIDLVGTQLTILHIGEPSAITQPQPVSAPQPAVAVPPQTARVEGTPRGNVGHAGGE
jgi:hypothetical protein